jgi:hypothetical protein
MPGPVNNRSKLAESGPEAASRPIELKLADQVQSVPQREENIRRTEGTERYHLFPVVQQNTSSGW